MMRKSYRLFFCAWLALAGIAVSRAGNPLRSFSNPVVRESAPDPTVWQEGGVFYQMNTGVRALRISEDLVHWVEFASGRKEIFTEEALAEAFKLSPRGGFWAPDVVKIKDRWMLYLTCYTTAENSKIAAFSSVSPSGPFEFEGVITDGTVTGIKDTIDPEVVIDPDSGKVWLFFGSIGGIHRVELDSEGTALANPEHPEYKHVAGLTTEQSPDRRKVFEGSYLYRRDGWWYLFASGGVFSDSSYRIVVGRSLTLDGVFTDKDGLPMTEGNATTILSTKTTTAEERRNSSNGITTLFGPGHNGEIFTDKRGFTYILYHVHDASINPQAPRAISLQRIYWDKEGWPYFAPATPAEKETAPRF